jgi:hypothetical protein
MMASEGYTVEGFDDSDFAPIAYTFFGNAAYARTEPDAYDCLLRAAGVTMIVDLINGGIKKLGKKGVLKVLKKVASKYLGWVGAAVAVYEFADCMGVFGADGEEGGPDLSFVRPEDKLYEIYDKVRFA